MKIENLKTDSLIPYEWNNRKHSEEQISRIANSIQEFGFNQPIVTCDRNVVLVGHARLEAAKRLGLETVPVVRLSKLSEAQKKAYRILDNKLQNDSEWNFDNLELELSSLEEMDFDLGSWGLDELKDLVGQNMPAGETTEDDFEVPEEIRTDVKRGDLIELGRHRVLCGDSTSAEDCAELFSGAIAEMCFTDPPYGVAYEGGHFHSGDVNIKRSRESLAGDSDSILYKRFLPVAVQFVNGPFYMWFAGSHGLDVYQAVEAANCEVHALIIWHKINAKYAAMNAQYKQRHEPCLYFKPSKSTLRWTGPSDECTIWEEKRDARNEFHPTQKPVCVAARAIGNHSAKTVADFFLGSGTTLIAADQLDRICYGMEIEPKYCQVIIDRYFKYCTDRNKPFECKINGSPYFG